MNEYKRILNFQDTENESVFFFGARQTGKTTLLLDLFPKAIYYDLLESDTLRPLKEYPSLLRESLQNKPEGTLVIIDEIQQVPELLNEVHWLIVRKGLRFILSGSSARKLKRNGANTLGGRAIPVTLFPLVSAEIPDFDIYRAVNNGMLPQHYKRNNPRPLLKAYIDIYLKEEIRSEAITRNLNSFTRFLKIAAMTDGEIVNYTNIASECGISANTVKEHFNILIDTLIGYMIPAYTKSKGRRMVQAPKFYYFDVGIANHLLNRQNLQRGTLEFGHAFEHFVIQELKAYLSYNDCGKKLSYWRTYTGLEVDAVIGEAEFGIEIKSSDEVQPRHLKGLHAFSDEFPKARLLIISFDRFTRTVNGIEYWYIHDFLKALWNHEIIIGM